MSAGDTEVCISDSDNSNELMEISSLMLDLIVVSFKFSHFHLIYDLYIWIFGPLKL